MNFATTLTKAVSAIPVVSSAVASGVALFTGGLSGLASAFNLGAGIKTLNGVSLPLPNPLFAYASYDYVLSIGCLPPDFLNSPDTTYRAGKRFPLVCKSANADPSNRVQTPYGKFDFFIEDMELKSLIGNEEGQNTNVTNINFKIIEPYSMGMFMISCQQIAYQCGYNNWHDAPFIIGIEFRGNTERGQISNIPGTARYIPFKFTNVGMTVNENGAVYTCEGLPFNQEALADANAKFKSDVSMKGTTVQEMLQTGDKSLQVVLNKKLKDIAKANNVEVPDEILILFPVVTASSAGSGSGVLESSSSATGSSADSLLSKIGVTRTGADKNENLVQDPGMCNAIGQAKMGFSQQRKGSAPIGQDNEVYDPEKKIYVRAANNVNPEETDMKFRQDTDITNAINQVIIQSEFIDQTFDISNLTPEGGRNWWRIDVQSYIIPTTANDSSTGQKPRLLVYRVVPYEAHASALMPVNTKAPGFNNLRAQAVKEYNYIYTGKNVDVTGFEIKYQANFMNVMAADGLERTQDNVTAASSGATEDPANKVKVTPLGEGNAPQPGIVPRVVKFISTLTGTDKLGGGGAETQGSRAARLFHDAITKGTDMVNLELRIIGDPYWIAQSGQGNYTSTATQFKNLNADGSVNYQNGEVDVLVNFRTPIDINQSTGLYNFGGSSKSAPVMQFSGLYKVTNVISSFSRNEFKQYLTGYRRPLQEAKLEASPDQTFSPKKTEPANPDAPDGEE